MSDAGKKVLWFEGAGNVPRGPVENCRIRTAFQNDAGSLFYLELSGMEVTKHTPDRLRHFNNVGFVDHCYYIRLSKDDENYNRHDIERRTNFEYSKAGILNLVNTELGCSFDEIRVADSFFGYRVHKDGPHKGDYRHNFMEDHIFDERKAAAARAAFHRADMDIREKLGEKWSKISLAEVGDSAITVHCYASDESMRKHGMDPAERRITVPFEVGG